MKKITSISILFIINFVSFNISFSQSKNLTIVVERIVKINEVQSEFVGIGGEKSENYQNFIQLYEIASTEELIHLTDNENSTVACYASWALADKSYYELKSIFLKFILNDKQVDTFRGCIALQSTISSELYHRYWNKLNETKRATDKILLELDSIILFSQNPFWLLLQRALENRIYIEPFKSQISFLAFNQCRKEAIFYLCNWHKAEYIVQIKASLLKYLNETEFKKTGTSDYYTTIEELFKFKDPEIRFAIIAKMKKDRHWEYEKQRFKYLLIDNHIFNLENK